MWWVSSFRAPLQSIMPPGTSVTMHPMHPRAHGAGIQRPALCLQSCNCQCALSHTPPCLCQTRLAHWHANISRKHLFQHVGKFDGCGCCGTDRPVPKAIVRKILRFEDCELSQKAFQLLPDLISKPAVLVDRWFRRRKVCQ